MPDRPFNSARTFLPLLLTGAVLSAMPALCQVSDAKNEEISADRPVLNQSSSGKESGPGARPAGAENLPGDAEVASQTPGATDGETGLINAGKDKPVVKGHMHRLKMRLAGSMCAACLKELRKKLEGFKGIEKVKIDYPVITHSTRYSSAGAMNWAEASIDYYPNLAPLGRLKLYLRNQGYNPYRIVDRPQK